MVKKIGHDTVAELEVAGKVAALLGEPNRDFYGIMVWAMRQIGQDALLGLAQQAADLFQEGAKTPAGNRRRTPGGNLFALLRLRGLPHPKGVHIRKQKRLIDGKRKNSPRTLPLMAEARHRKIEVMKILTPEECEILKLDGERWLQDQRDRKASRLALRNAEKLERRKVNKVARQHKEAEARTLALGGMPAAEVAKLLGLGESTVLRLITPAPPLDDAQSQ